MSVNNFDVLKKLQMNGCQLLKAFPLSNIRNMQTIKNGLGIVEMTVDQETIFKMTDNKVLGMLIVVDADIFNEAKKRMEQEPERANDKLQHNLKKPLPKQNRQVIPNE